MEAGWKEVFPAGPFLVWRLPDYSWSAKVTLPSPLSALLTLRQLSIGSWGLLPEAGPHVHQVEI